MLRLEGFLHRVTMSRGQAQDLLKLKLAPRERYPSTREETIAAWASGYRKLPLNWQRDGNLIRRGKPNKPRPGSSREVMDPKSTRVMGADKVLRDLKQLIGTVQKLQREHGRADVKALQKAYKAVRVTASAQG